MSLHSKFQRDLLDSTLRRQSSAPAAVQREHSSAQSSAPAATDTFSTAPATPFGRLLDAIADGDLPAPPCVPEFWRHPRGGRFPPASPEDEESSSPKAAASAVAVGLPVGSPTTNDSMLRQEVERNSAAIQRIWSVLRSSGLKESSGSGSGQLVNVVDDDSDSSLSL